MRQGCGCGQPFVRRHADLGRVEHGVFDVEAPFFVPLDQGMPGVAQAGAVLCGQEDGGSRWQVVEQRGGLLEEQRQVVLDAGGCEAFADVAVQRHPREIALETGAEAPPEILDGLGRQAELARGEQVEALQFLDGTLRFGVEAADAVDDVVEEVDAQGRLAAHREHVEQRAADCKVAGLRDLRHARVARTRQAQPELFELERFAGVEAECMPIDERARGEALQRRWQVHEHDAALERRQPCQRPQALRNDVRVRRELVVGQRLVTREPEDGQARRAEESQFLLEACRGGCIVRDQQDRACGLARCACNVQRRRGAGQSGPAQARMFGGGQRCGVVGRHRNPASNGHRSTAPGRGRG